MEKTVEEKCFFFFFSLNRFIHILLIKIGLSIWSCIFLSQTSLAAFQLISGICKRISLSAILEIQLILLLLDSTKCAYKSIFCCQTYAFPETGMRLILMIWLWWKLHHYFNSWKKSHLNRKQPFLSQTCMCVMLSFCSSVPILHTLLAVFRILRKDTLLIASFAWHML